MEFSFNEIYSNLIQGRSRLREQHILILTIKAKNKIALILYTH